jgi:hypothetical protein
MGHAQELGDAVAVIVGAGDLSEVGRRPSRDLVRTGMGDAGSISLFYCGTSLFSREQFPVPPSVTLKMEPAKTRTPGLQSAGRREGQVKFPVIFPVSREITVENGSR